MQRLIWTVLLSFAMATVIGPLVIPWLKRMKFGQTIYELGPETHKVKQGTPTMGGIIFAVPMLVAPVVMSYEAGRLPALPMVLAATLGFGLIGFADDFIKVTKKRSLGLTARQKLIPQILLAIALSAWAYFSPEVGSSLIVPFFGLEWDLGMFYIPVMAFILVGTVNSANLLDGLDGLLTSCSLLDFATMALIAMGAAALSGADGLSMNMMVFCGAAAGALLGFLRFNNYPASVFMGDVGSFVIGGALAAVCMVMRLSLLLPIIAFAMFVSSLSDIIQIGYFKYTRKKTGTGRRVFRMAPLQHHFELGGMPETRIVTMYMIVTALLCLLVIALYAG